MSSHSSWPTGGLGGLGGLGPIMTSLGGGEPAKKFSSQDCIDALVAHLTDHPEDIQNQLNLIVDSQVQEYRRLHPSALDPDAWTRLSTHRPSVDDDGEPLLATDREVRTYENDVWADAGRSLISKVTTEHGEIHSITTVVQW